MTETPPQFAFTSEQDAAAKLQAAGRAAGVRLYPLPFSRFAPERTTWWLSPDATNPAYSRGNLVVENATIVDDGVKLIGLHMEKGVGEEAAEFFQASAHDRHQVMDRTWTWHPFLRALRSGELEATMRGAETAADGLPLVIEVVAGPALPRGGGEEHPLDVGAADRIRYSVTDDSLVCVKRRTRTKLRKLADAEDLASIGERISQIDDLDWTWVEVLIGVAFRPVATGGLAAMEVWRRVCAPWMTWAR
jgi:hypothetical protein